MNQLEGYNTFKIQANARELIKIHSQEDLRTWSQSNSGRPFLIIGGGSNLLFVSDVEQTVLLNRIKGIEIVHEDEEYALVEVASGENWHEWVTWAVGNNLGGIENLALIPGSVGAAPVQNIGAYGVEVKEVIEEVRYFDMEDGSVHSIAANACQFSYRNSLFKNQLKGTAFITSVRFRLTKKEHKLKLSYGSIEAQLKQHNVEIPGIRDVFDAVIQIRQTKLPDPEKLGNAGSFFKNPVVPLWQFRHLKNVFPDLPHFPQNEKEVKIPAAWLIEKAGWKGKRIGDAGCYKYHTLVLVNHGKATGREIYDLSRKIIYSVHARFGITLEEEVNIIGDREAV